MILFFAVLSLISIFAFDYTCNKDCDEDEDLDIPTYQRRGVLIDKGHTAK